MSVIIINNSSELKAAYETLLFLNECAQCSVKNRRVLNERIKETKQRIRDYHKRSRKNTFRIIHDDGIDGYISLEEAPSCFVTIEQVINWFEENKMLVPMPSLYDCTGQPFTISYKVVRRRGRFFIYHSVGFDV